MMTDRQLEKAKYVSRDLSSGEAGDLHVEFWAKEPDWDYEKRWWIAVLSIDKISASEFLRRYGWCPKPGECFEVYWADRY